MKYYVNLEQNFVDLYSFLKQHPNASFPANFFENDSTSPFFMGPVLYFPICVGTGQQYPYAGTLGLVKAKVTNSLGLSDTQIRIMPDEESLKAAGVRLSPQSVKMMKSLRLNSNAFESDHNWSTRGFRCRAEEIVKCLALGYLQFSATRSIFEQLAYSDYTLQSFVTDKRNSMNEVTKKMVDHFYKQEKSHWTSRAQGQRMTQGMVRSDKTPDDTCVVKWRKPSKNSKWPFTMDHHWFTCQESPVAMAHHTLLSLMNDRHSNRNRDQLMVNLPVFSHIRQLEVCRKLLENFFTNLTECMKPHSSVFGNYVSQVNDFEWPNNRYSNKRIPAEMFPVKACLAMGVLPSFDKSGKFDKFVPINGHLHDNQETLYFEFEVDGMVRRRADISLILLYSTGLISRENLESVVGPVSVTGAGLKQDPSKVQLHISKNVVCCLPVDAASVSVYNTMTKYGIRHNSSSSSSVSEPVQELTEDEIASDSEVDLTF